MIKINNNSSHEIERRWILTKIPKEISIKNKKFTKIKQCYLSLKPVIRLRSHDNSKFILCIKTQGLKKSLARPEQEVELNHKEYKSLFAKSITQDIIKKRFFIKYKNQILELDIFDGVLKGLIILELEFKTEKEAINFIAPEWFGKEITGIKKYANSSLAKLL